MGAGVCAGVHVFLLPSGFVGVETAMKAEGSKKTLLITTLRQHLADNARMLGSVRHDWEYVRYARREDVPVVPYSHVCRVGG